MAGRWLIRIGGWVTRRETFERMLAPAIADMQAESSRGRFRRFRHYLACSVVLVYALLWDFRMDAVMAFGGEIARVAWKRAAIWYAGFVALMTYPGVSMEGIWLAAFASSAWDAIVTALSIAIIPAVLYLSRGMLSTRSIAVATIVAALATFTFAWAVRPLRLVSDRVVVERIESVRADYVRNASGHYVDERIAWWLDFHSGLRVIPSALVGIVLARRRGWWIPLTVVGLFATWFLLVIRLNSFGWLRAVHDRVWQGWRELALNAAMVMIWLVADEVMKRVRGVEYERSL